MKFPFAVLSGLTVGLTMALPQAPADNSVHILTGLPDGGYMIGLQEDGTPYIAAHYPVPDLEDRNMTVPDVAQKVPASHDQWGCVETEFVDPAKWVDAALNLAAWCNAGNMVQPKKILTWITGDSEAYVCNWAGEQNCNGEEYWNYMANPIDYYCSHYHSGWVLKGSDNKGYGRGVRGQRGDSLKICFNP